MKHGILYFCNALLEHQLLHNHDVLLAAACTDWIS